MVKLIAGLKGSGKTKSLIDMANGRIDESNGSVVCVEKGTKLIHEINHRGRLIDTEEYKIADAKELYGFVAGLYASNRDITDLFIDSALKICGDNMDAFKAFMLEAGAFAEACDINLTVTASVRCEDLPADLKKYL